MMSASMRERAVRYTARVLIEAKDWQDGQHALAEHPEFGAWLDAESGGDELARLVMAQSIVREAETA